MRLTVVALSLIALFITACPTVTDTPVPTAASPEASEAPACEWENALSGRFYVQPRSAWLDAGVETIYDQVHWWLEVESMGTSGEVCGTHPRQRPEGAGTCLLDQVGPTSVLGASRTMVLGVMVEKGLLPESKGRSNSFPHELYPTGEQDWRRMVQQELMHRFDGNIEFCRVRLTLRMKRRQGNPPSDGKWWDEHVQVFPEGDGECCR